MLWRGIWAYVKFHRIDAMIGCASIEGTDTAKISSQLSFLHHFAQAAPQWQTSPLAHRFASMNLMPRRQVEVKKALLSLPPLIKGYMRLGAKFGNGAVVDRQFGVTDVFVIMPINEIEGRYIEYFDTDNAVALLPS
jgi:putative hemolysin